MANGLDEAVLIVVIGYRLGAAGYFSLPELRNEYALERPRWPLSYPWSRRLSSRWSDLLSAP